MYKLKLIKLCLGVDLDDLEGTVILNISKHILWETVINSYGKKSFLQIRELSVQESPLVLVSYNLDKDNLRISKGYQGDFLKKKILSETLYSEHTNNLNHIFAWVITNTQVEDGHWTCPFIAKLSALPKQGCTDET